jgi:hypothetical protein
MEKRRLMRLMRGMEWADNDVLSPKCEPSFAMSVRRAGTIAPNKVRESVGR